MILYVVADRGSYATTDGWLRAIAVIATSGAELQLRAKDASFEERAAAVAVATAHGGRPWLNGSTADAVRAGAAGVHWPDLRYAAPSTAAPRPSGLRAAASVHSRASVDLAVAAGAEFVVFGPVYDPGSKPGSGVGAAALADIVRHSPVPVVAIGGVTPARVRSCLDAGAAGVAVVSGVTRAEDPLAAIDTYLRQERV